MFAVSSGEAGYSDQLPFTGSDLGLYVLLGALLVLGGLMLWYRATSWGDNDG